MAFNNNNLNFGGGGLNGGLSSFGGGIGGGFGGAAGGFGGVSALNRLDPSALGSFAQTQGLTGLDGASGVNGTDPTAQLGQSGAATNQLMQQLMQMIMQLMQNQNANGNNAGQGSGGGGTSPVSGAGSSGGGSSPSYSGGGDGGGVSGGGDAGSSSPTSSTGTTYDGATAGSSADAKQNAQIVAQVAKEKGIDPVTAVATMLVESGGSNQATGDNGSSFGLFQLHRGGELGNMSEADARDPRKNAETALSVFAQNKDKYSDPGQLAAASQRPADPQGYAAKVDAKIPEAKKLLGLS